MKKSWIKCKSCEKLKSCKAGQARIYGVSDYARDEVGCFNYEMAERQLNLGIQVAYHG